MKEGEVGSGVRGGTGRRWEGGVLMVRNTDNTNMTLTSAKPRNDTKQSHS